MTDIMLMGKNPNYLGSWDLYDVQGSTITATISKIKDEEIINNGQKETCTVCYFEENIKPMILNNVNKKMISKLYKTKYAENLIGKRITIGYEKIKAFGQLHDALRIKDKVIETGKKIKCEMCGNYIKPAYGMTEEQLANYTNKKYGKAVCSECGAKLKQQEDNTDDEIKS